DIPAERADAVLDELVDSGFVQPTDMTGRYRMLELFRLYAAAAIKAGDTELDQLINHTENGQNNHRVTLVIGGGSVPSPPPPVQSVS
ncbi:MAG: hypothetical protein J2O49_01920, partial [Sciscionella sp.]|nr:hypothetical protein [Sciscionella sp.]